MPIARKFTRSAVLRIDADAWKSRLWLCNSMSIRAYHPLPDVASITRCSHGEDGRRIVASSRRLSKFLSRVKVCGPTQLPCGMESLVREQPRPNFALPREREEVGIREIDSLRSRSFRSQFSTCMRFTLRSSRLIRRN